jgi:hypothetical protein
MNLIDKVFGLRAVLLKKNSLGRKKIPPGIALGIIALCLFLGLSLALLEFFAPGCFHSTEFNQPDVLLIPENLLPTGNKPGGPLAIGTKVPLLCAQGWVNGLPPLLDSTTSSLTVLVLWSHW